MLITKMTFIRFLIMQELFVTLFNLFHMKEQFWNCASPHSSSLRYQMQKLINGKLVAIPIVQAPIYLLCCIDFAMLILRHAM